MASTRSEEIKRAGDLKGKLWSEGEEAELLGNNHVRKEEHSLQ